MKKGFTIVELLIVVSVISILAAIAIVSYNGVSQRAQDTSVQADLEGLAGQLEAHRVRSTPREFPRTAAVLQTLNIKAAKGAYKTTIPLNFIYCADSTDTQEFALIAESRSGRIFMINQEGFKTQSLTESNLTLSVCSGQGMDVQLSGMSSANTWQTWVGSS
ncbi:MAG TPA: prepilin-type N-terminal cleavage/methylation domain-containing protein [Candidatus Saccharimonadales bacterium]|nr:prepilin-type N-terminal cleavage/methylation domain-containing protein [Candidatus Saccharimonadales bacterium]